MFTTARVIPLREYTARHAASLTEALLHSVSRGAPPTIAYFAWKKGITLPYVQSIKDVNLDACAHHGYEVARIAGGGRAYVHGPFDFSIAVVSKANEVNIPREYERLCESIALALKDLAIPAVTKRRTHTTPTGLVLDGYDVEVNGQKIAGYAQAWNGTCVLQHGAFVYQQPDLALWPKLFNLPANISPEHVVKGIEKLITPLSNYTTATPEQITTAISKRLAREYLIGTFSANEIAFAAELENKLYTTNYWKNHGTRSRGLCLYPYGDDPAGSLVGEIQKL